MWQLADAKNRLSELVDLAVSGGPQRISRRGRDTVVVISIVEYDRLTGAKPSFRDYLTQGESLEGVDLERDTSPSRDVDL
jgi:antitoxin Phd